MIGKMMKFYHKIKRKIYPDRYWSDEELKQAEIDAEILYKSIMGLNNGK